MSEEVPRLEVIHAQPPPEEVPAPKPEPIIQQVETVIAPTPMPLMRANPRAKGPWIKYTGPGTVRILDGPAWQAAGVPSTKYCEWNYLNKKRLPRSMFTDEELQYLLRVDGRFVLVEE